MRQSGNLQVFGHMEFLQTQKFFLKNTRTILNMLQSL